MLHVLFRGVEHREKYPEKVRHFCLGLHYFSPRAYEHVRRTFNNHLPHERTIRRWYQNSNIQNEPGIHQETVQRLKKIADDFASSNGSKMICSLTFDEVFLRKQIHWSMNQMDYVGQISNADSEMSAATAAIVFLLNGVNTNFEFPVAYYLIVSLDKLKRKYILEEIINAVSKCGIKISNITFDGLAANFAMCECFGANLDVGSENFKPFFKNPTTNENIYIMLDPCHMEKLVRNTLAAKGIIFDRDNQKIEWRYFESLIAFSEKNDFRTHKINKKHIQWKRNSMNVSVAVQTLSDSVANSMEFLMQQNHPEFEGASATINFIRIMNKLFDIFNTKHLRSANVFKCALNERNKRIIFDFLQGTIKYFEELMINKEQYVKNKKNPKRAVEKVEKISILKSRNKTAFRGFIIDMYSLMFMYREYIEEQDILQTIPTYYMLQDAVELFFCRIRSCCGFNNNPNTSQFKGAYKKLQANMKLITSERGNCRVFDAGLPENLNYSDIYYITSKRAAIVAMAQSSFDENYENQKDAILEDIVCIHQAETTDHLIDITTKFVIAHTALLIERKIRECPRFYCDSCRLVFEENEKLDILDSSSLQSMPCTSTFDICKTADTFFKLYDIRNSNKKYDFRVLYCLIFRSMDFSKLFKNSKFECDPNHKYQFVKCIVGTYIAFKARYISKQYTLSNFKHIFRQQLNRMVIFDGQ